MMKISHNYKFESRTKEFRIRLIKKNYRENILLICLFLNKFPLLWTISLDQSIEEVDPGETGRRESTQGPRGVKNSIQDCASVPAVVESLGIH